jgi:hypothetical protein
MMLALFACNRPEFLKPCLQSVYSLLGELELAAPQGRVLGVLRVEGEAGPEWLAAP